MWRPQRNTVHLKTEYGITNTNSDTNTNIDTNTNTNANTNENTNTDPNRNTNTNTNTNTNKKPRLSMLRLLCNTLHLKTLKTECDAPALKCSFPVYFHIYFEMYFRGIQMYCQGKV